MGQIQKRGSSTTNVKKTQTPPITAFIGPHAFLSNFHSCTIRFDGIIYPDVETAYQCQKTLSQPERDHVMFVYDDKGVPIRRTTPGEAKRAGKRVTKRKDWYEVKIDVMRELLIEKFKTSRLADLLIATGDAELVEVNTWGDVFWGVVNGKGENHMGKLLMEIREALR